MTEKLYYYDQYLYEFYGIVTSVTPNGDNFDIILDRTAFFPEEGGQCHDKGLLDGQDILYVREEKGEIIHTVKEEIRVKKRVFCNVDEKVRFRNMQNHSGEHIVSGLICNKFGCNNVGFHLGHEFTTADYDIKLNRNILDEIEDEANAIVYKNKKIKSWFPCGADLKKISYRYKSNISSDIRLVQIPDCDICACCAPHVARTGEIGIIKILDFEMYKGGTRIYIKCGHDAMLDYREKYSNISAVSSLLSAKHNEVSSAVEQFYGEYKELKREVRLLSGECLKLKLKNVQYSEEPIYYLHTSKDMNELRIIADELSNKTDGFSVSCFSENGISYFTVISKNISLLKLTNFLRENLGAKCGGKDNIIQGNVSCSFDYLIDAVTKWYYK